jgi:hypothetical protein
MRRINFIISISFLFAVSLIQGCTNDAAYPDVCFTSEIRPIFTSNCAMTNCHDGSSNSEAHGIVLTDYTNIMKGIKPFHPGQSKYFNVLKGVFGGSMPPKKSLSSEQVALIKAWIEQGAKETNCTGSSCDTSNVTYSGTIAGILTSNCTACHNSSNTSGGVNIDGYTNLKNYLDANQSSFINCIGYNSSIKMPPSYKLSVCEIAQINKWILAGYLNNK